MEMKRKLESSPDVSEVKTLNRVEANDSSTAPTSKIKTRKRSILPDIHNPHDVVEPDMVDGGRDDPISDDDASEDDPPKLVERRISFVLDDPAFPSALGTNPSSPDLLEPSRKNSPSQDAASPQTIQDSIHPTYPPKRARNRNPGNLLLDLSQMSPIPSPKHTKSDYANVCSQVTDFLFVGGAVVAAQREVLEGHGITHVINCAASVTPNFFPRDFDYFNLRLRDHATQDIHQHFYNIFQFIDAARADHGKVFIHCVKGISRSPTMAIAYLMAREHLSLYPALELVRASRPVIDPNAGFIFQLSEWDAARQNTRKQVKVFRVAMAASDADLSASRYPLIIGPIQPDQLIASRNPTQEQIHDEHATSCFVICSIEAKYCTLWCGRDASDELVETGKQAVRLLQTYEGFPDTFDIVWSGQEPSAFWSVLAPENDPNSM
ncbi:hypothetical protein AC1031_008628 [Aphanomyces cochlioides]|nr:hypothetical protein AC1031_008628 [Aphanomyces cochlioides]